MNDRPACGRRRGVYGLEGYQIYSNRSLPQHYQSLYSPQNQSITPQPGTKRKENDEPQITNHSPRRTTSGPRPNNLISSLTSAKMPPRRGMRPITRPAMRGMRSSRSSVRRGLGRMDVNVGCLRGEARTYPTGTRMGARSFLAILRRAKRAATTSYCSPPKSVPNAATNVASRTQRISATNL
jgi:hypothetical protein